MEIRLLVLTAFIASSGLPSVQPKIQMGIKAIANDVNTDNKVQQNLRSLFESLSKNDVKHTGSLRYILEREAEKEQKAFDTMKDYLRFTHRQRNLHKKGDNGEKAVVFKRETDGDAGEKKAGTEGNVDNLSGAKVDEKKDEEKKEAGGYKNSRERSDQREDDRQYRSYRGDRDNSRFSNSRPGYYRGGSYDRRDDRPPYSRRDGGRPSYDRPVDYGRRDGSRPSYERRDNWPPYEKRDDRRPYGRDDDGRRPYNSRDDDGRRSYRREDDGRRPYNSRDDDGRRSYRREDEDRRPYQKEGNDRKDDSKIEVQMNKTDDVQRENGTSETSKVGGEDGASGVVDKHHNRTDNGSTDAPSATASEPASKREDGANDTRSEPGGRREDESARRRNDEPDRRSDRGDGDDDRYGRRRGGYERRGDDDRYERRGNRGDRYDDQYVRRDDDRYERGRDRYERRGDDGRDGDRYGRRDDRDYRRDDPPDHRDSGPAYRGRDRPSFGNRFEADEKPTFRRRFDRNERRDEYSSDRREPSGNNDSKERSEDEQSSSRYSYRRDDGGGRRDDGGGRRGDYGRDRPERGETKRPWVARGMVNAHDMYVDALKESINVLQGQENYISLMREPIKIMYSPNVNQTNVNWTLAEPLKLLNRTEECIQKKIKGLVRQSTKDVTFDDMVTPMDTEYFTLLSNHWMALKNYLLDHNPGPEHKPQYVSLVEQLGKAHDNMALEYKVVKNIVKKLDAMKS